MLFVTCFLFILTSFVITYAITTENKKKRFLAERQIGQWGRCCPNCKKFRLNRITWIGFECNYCGSYYYKNELKTQPEPKLLKDKN